MALDLQKSNVRSVSKETATKDSGEITQDVISESGEDKLGKAPKIHSHQKDDQFVSVKPERFVSHAGGNRAAERSRDKAAKETLEAYSDPSSDHTVYHQKEKCCGGRCHVPKDNRMLLGVILTPCFWILLIVVSVLAFSNINLLGNDGCDSATLSFGGVTLQQMSLGILICAAVGTAWAVAMMIIGGVDCCGQKTVCAGITFICCAIPIIVMGSIMLAVLVPTSCGQTFFSAHPFTAFAATPGFAFLCLIAALGVAVGACMLFYFISAAPEFLCNCKRLGTPFDPQIA
jgi:hypothetical protein